MRLRPLVAATTATTLLAAGAALLAPSAASAAAPLPTLTVTMTAKKITTSTGSSMHAGRVIIKAVAVGGERDLQLMKLTPGYTLAQADKDINQLFFGKVAVVKRVDSKIRFLGGTAAVPGTPGMFAETLYAGTYVLADSNSAVRSVLHVTGTPPRRGWVAQTSTITGTGADRWSMPSSIPHAGWTLFRDTADEPHFIVMLQVKPGTTARQLGSYLASGSGDAPPFALPAQASSGVISGGNQILWHYSLPRGTYAILCFWPSDETGMPHANMGMYKIITLT
jgi:hypothetical protein